MCSATGLGYAQNHISLYAKAVYFGEEQDGVIVDCPYACDPTLEFLQPKLVDLSTCVKLARTSTHTLTSVAQFVVLKLGKTKYSAWTGTKKAFKTSKARIPINLDVVPSFSIQPNTAHCRNFRVKNLRTSKSRVEKNVANSVHVHR